MRRDQASDEGSALIMALIITTVIALVVGALLSFAGMTQQTTTLSYRAEAGGSYTTDGAVQQAVNTLQRGAFINDEGQPCFTGGDTSANADTDTMVVPDADGTGSVAVVCEGTPGTGVQSPDVPITSVNKPGNAILTLGTSEGINLSSTYNFFNTFNVGGPVFSNSTITTNNRALTARDYVIARGACSDPSKITPAAQCNYGSAFDTRGVDPNYPLPTLPAYRAAPSVPSCVLGIFSTVTFQPGYYDDAAALNAITSRGCTYHFTPGTYYFDFHNGDNSALDASSHEWRVTSGRLIGGTRTGFLALDCLSPLKSTTNNGVRFVFGGNSRLTVAGGSAALCGTYSSTAPAIAFQGVRSGSETTQNANGLAPTGQSAVDKFVKYTNTTAGTAATAWQGVTSANDTPQSLTARWVKSGNGSQSGYLETTGYAPGAAVPAGSVIDAMTVKVRHNNATAQNADTRAVVLTIGGNSCTLPVSDTASGSLSTESLNVLTTCSAAFVDALHTSGVQTSGTSLRYNVTLTRAGTEVLDQLALDVSYRAPAFRTQQTGVTGDSCVLGNAYVPAFAGTATGCAALDLDLGSLNLSSINGTVYAPHASIAVQMDAVSASALRSGIITRSLYVQTTGVLNYASVASIPFSSQGTDPSAYLTAYVCPTASTCSASTGAARLKAKVTLVGQDTSVRRAAKIPSYSVQQ